LILIERGEEGDEGGGKTCIYINMDWGVLVLIEYLYWRLLSVTGCLVMLAIAHAMISSNVLQRVWNKSQGRTLPHNQALGEYIPMR